MFSHHWFNLFKVYYLLSFLLLWGVFANAKMAHRDWQRFETEHFIIVFDKEQKDLALDYAIEAEFIYDVLIPHYALYPQKTWVIIDDAMDIVNASATFYPRPLMRMHPKQPPPFLFNFIHYGSWTQTLLIHEYTHVLSLTPGGSWQIFRRIFGNAFTPNGFLPIWYLEGVAVDMESRFSRFGRLNSPLFYAEVRSMVEGGTWGKEDISRINEQSIPTWPFGNRPYFFGSLLINEISNSEGIEQLDALNQLHARKSKTFLNTVPRRLFQKSYQTVLQTAYKRWQLHSEKDLAIIKQQPVQKSQKLLLFNTQENIIERHSPHISPDGMHLIFIQRSVEKGSQIILLSRSSTDKSFLDSKGKVVARGRGIETIHWINNEEFVFDRIKETRKGSLIRAYNDLYKGSVSGRRPRRLTYAQRLQFPSFAHPTHFLAIQNNGSNSRLVQVSLDGKDIELLYTPDKHVRLSTPLALTENAIVFVAKTTNGSSLLKLWNRNTKQVKDLEGGLPGAILPVKVENGLIYSSDRSGVPNLYFWKAQDQTSYAITNSTTAIRDGFFDHHTQELWVSQLHVDGYRLEAHKSQLEPVQVPILSIPHASDKKPLDSSSNIVVADQGKKTLLENSPARKKWQTHFEQSPPNVKKYRGLSYLIPPSYWIPWFSHQRLAGSYLGKDVNFIPYIRLGGTDPLNHHNYRISVRYHTLFKKIDGSFTYNHHRRWYFNINDTQKLNLVRLNELANQDQLGYFLERQTTAFLSKGFFLNSYFDLSLGWMVFRSSASSQVMDAQGSDLPETYSTPTVIQHGPFVGLNYNNALPDAFFATSESFYINYTHLFKKSNVPAYQALTTGANLVWTFSNPLGSRKQPVLQNSDLKYHALLLKTDHSFQQPGSPYYVASSSSGYDEEWMPLFRGLHLMRGYPSGAFFGQRLHSANLEYTFPLIEIQKGYGTSFLFFREIDMAMVFDAIALDGYYINQDKQGVSVNPNRLFSSIGAELKLNTTVRYVFPVTIGLGVYYGFQKNAQGGLHIGLITQIAL